MQLVTKHYPRAQDNRLPYSHPLLKASRPKLLKAAAINFIILQLLFFALFCYLFGSLYQQGPRTHSMKIVWVDYDGGVIGEAVRNAYNSLRSQTFPTLVERPSSEYPSANSLYEAVCNTDYWAALYTVSGSSVNLGLTIAGLNTTQYNQSNVLAYIWNEARYPTIVDSAISSNMNALSNAAQIAYITLNGTEALPTIPPNNPAALSAFTNPWILSSIDIKPTVQGSRAVYNTIVIVLILLEDFFFLATVNGLYAQFKVYTRALPSIIILIREMISITYTMVGAMLIAAAIWAFKADWEVSGTQFALTWLTLWLFAHVNFLMLDVFTIWIPPVYVPMALVTWVITNVTSIIIPFTLSNPFYRVGYALPAHSVYEVLIDIWSGGCNPHLYFALPILFSYEVVGTIFTSLGVYRRCHMAVIAEEAAIAAASLRRRASLKAAPDQEMRFVPERRDSERPHTAESIESRISEEDNGQPADSTATDSEALERERTRREEEAEQSALEIQRLETRASRASNFPAFRLLGSHDSDDD